MWGNSQKSLIKHLDFIIADVFILLGSFLLSNKIYKVTRGGGLIYNAMFRHMLLLFIACEGFSLLLNNNYKGILKRDKFQEIKSVFVHTVNMAVFYFIAIFFTKDAGSMSRLIIVLTWSIYFVLELIFRWVWKRLLRHHFLVNRTTNKNAILVLTTNKERAEEFYQNLHVTNFSNYFVKGFYFIDHTINKEDTIEGIPFMGNETDMIEYATNHWVDGVLIDSVVDHSTARTITKHFSKMGITVNHVLVQFQDDEEDDMPNISKYGNYVVATKSVRDVPLYQWILKRTLDIVGAVVGLIFTFLIFLFVAPQIYKADPGPIFYASTRIGKGGRKFKMWKFRSMYRDADARKAELMSQNKMNGLMFKMDDDPRIIGSEKKDKDGKPKGIGNFIRNTSLDEFPQFWNVLIGDMSLVGTRPPTVDEWEQYSEEHRIRMTMKPGITGMWQVSGRSEITDFDEVVALDTEYIETWSFGRDIRILLMTVAKVIKKEGAE